MPHEPSGGRHFPAIAGPSHTDESAAGLEHETEPDLAGIGQGLPAFGIRDVPSLGGSAVAVQEGDLRREIRPLALAHRHTGGKALGDPSDGDLHVGRHPAAD